MTKIRKPHNKRKSYFQFAMGLFLLILVGYGYLRVDNYLLEKRISEQKTLLDTQNKQLEISQNISEHTRLAAVKVIENSIRSIPRSIHIPKVIEMLEDLKAVDTSENETIVLSDFVVSLDGISLKGKVSSLPLLYINSEKRNYISLLDRFSQLDFIKDLRIQTYEKDESRDFEFVLNAKVMLNDTAE
jgi:hypothetical protein